MLYGVINIDIIQSRKIKNRITLQETLSQYVIKMNNKHKIILAAPITFTLGDELQVILKEPFKSYMIINHFQRFFDQFNINIYAGIGFGTLNTELYNDTRKMDGTCFIHARKAMEIAKTKNPYYNRYVKSKDNTIFFYSNKITLSDIRFNTPTQLSPYLFSNEVAATGENQKLTYNQLINNLIANTEILKKKMTIKQKEIITYYEEVGSYSKMIKRNPSLTKAGISQKLNTSNYHQILLNNSLIEQLLYSYCQVQYYKEGDSFYEK